jgi:hypothetical protein
MLAVKGFLCYGLAFVGIGIVLLAVLRGRAMTVNYAVARLALVNLLRSNPKAALQYCRSAPGTFFDSVAAALSTAAMSQSRDPVMIQAATYPSYDAGGAGIGIAWKMALGKAKLGAGMSWAAVAVSSMLKMSPVFFVILGVVALGGLGWLFWGKMEAERIVVLARHEILPEVERVFIEGRTVA